LSEAFTKEEIEELKASYRGFKVPAIVRFESKAGTPITKKYMYIVEGDSKGNWTVKKPMYDH